MTTIFTKSQAVTAADAMDGSQARRLLTGSGRTQRCLELGERSSAPLGSTG
jgi:hypothetical protein